MANSRTDHGILTASDRNHRIREVVNDLRRRRDTGESVSDTAVIDAHPDLMPEVSDQLRALKLLQEARRRADQWDLDEISESTKIDETITPGLSVRCPHCHEFIRVHVDASFANINCNHCGNEFSLASDQYQSTVENATTIGHFELLERIGTGGFGTVWEAHDTELDRTVALKIPHRSQLALGDMDLVVREARAAAQLNHPNIVSVHEIGRDREVMYIVSDLIQGDPLSDRFSTQRPAFRKAAELCATIATALHHAHCVGVIHRDLKPQNILVDAEDQPFITDFGLAKREAAEITVTAEGQVLGTPAYMSPEQAGGRAHQADCRSDIYSMGVILFELLTGELPYRGNTKTLLYHVLHTQAPSPRHLNSQIPRDLETMCLKCLEKETYRRYSSAEDLAEDLRRFMRDEPIQARPVGRLEKTFRWCRRNRVLATLIIACAATVVCGLAFFVMWQRQSAMSAKQKARAALQREIAARQRELLAREKTALEVARRRQSERESALQDYQLIQMSAHTDGWSGAAWKHIKRAAGKSVDAKLRDMACGALIGMDAHRSSHLEELGSWLEFSSAGNQLLVGGLRQYRAKVWDFVSNTTRHSKQAGCGPVAIVPDGSLLQLVAKSPASYVVWNVGQDRPVRELIIPTRPGSSPFAQMLPAMAITRNGSYAAASPALADRGGIVAVWKVATAELVCQIPQKAHALTFDPEENRIAVGTKSGQINIWSLETGEFVTCLQSTQSAINCLAFGRDAMLSDPDRCRPCSSRLTRSRRRGGHGGSLAYGHGLNDEPADSCVNYECQPDPRSRWLLAAGDEGGTVTVWDMTRHVPRSFCRGSRHQIHDIAFRSDGAVLASCGRREVRLWHTSTGQELLNLRAGNTILNVAISPDGKHLAHSNHRVHGDAGGIHVWRLENGRGIRTLYGLPDAVAKVAFSPNHEKLAALSHNWTIGIWDVTSGNLLRIFRPPAGLFVDNADFAFNNDANLFVFAAGSHATLWDVDSGHRLWSKKLPPGLGDQIAFHRSGQLLHFRYETLTGRQAPVSGAPPTHFPRVCRIRNLLAEDYLRPVLEDSHFNWHLYQSVRTSSGDTFVVEGIHVHGKDMRRSVRAYNAIGGKTLWDVPTENSHPFAHLAIGTNDQFVSVDKLDGTRAILLHLKSGSIQRAMPQHYRAFHPESNTAVSRPGASSIGCSLFDFSTDQRLLTIGKDIRRVDYQVQFSRDGKQLAWGSADGRVFVCDLPTVTNRINSLGVN